MSNWLIYTTAQKREAWLKIKPLVSLSRLRGRVCDETQREINREKIGQNNNGRNLV